jgi:hypothetical protein
VRDARDALPLARSSPCGLFKGNYTVAGGAPQLTTTTAILNAVLSNAQLVFIPDSNVYVRRMAYQPWRRVLYYRVLYIT